jgi:hypothetical protein
LKEEAASVEEEAVLDPAVQERCIKQPVLTARRKLKYLSNHLAIGLYTARNATRTIDQRDTEVIE